MGRVLQDLEFAVRLLLKDRGFTLTTVATLALCLAANAAIFAVVNSVLLRPLPFPAPEQILAVFNAYPGAGVERASNGVPDYYDRLAGAPAFESTSRISSPCARARVSESWRPATPWAPARGGWLVR
jgi:hypothetical protein